MGRSTRLTDAERAEAFGDLFAANQRTILAYAARRTDALADAQDVVAEVFAIAWRRLEELPADPQRARTWLFATARRVLANHFRGRRRAARLAARLEGQAPEAGPGDLLPEPAGERGLAMMALRRLDPAYQELILLSVWEEATVAEIAAVVGTSRANASVRLHRARRALRREFDRLVQEDDAPGRPFPVRASTTTAPEVQR